MTLQLTKSQIDAIKVELRKYGLNVLPLPRSQCGCVSAPRSSKAKPDELAARIARVQGMKFKTAGIKTAILRSLKTLQRDRAWKLAHPGNITDLLALFGVRLQDVQPWSDQRWECLRNGVVSSRLALPAPSSNDMPRGVFADATMQTRVFVTGGIAYGRRTLQQMNQT